MIGFRPQAESEQARLKQLLELGKAQITNLRKLEQGQRQFLVSFFLWLATISAKFQENIQRKVLHKKKQFKIQISQ